MRIWRFVGIIGAFALVAIAGCDNDMPALDAATDAGADAGPPPPTDGGFDAGSDAGVDPCAGRALCATAGTSCEDDELVVCAADAEGCLVETRTDCAAAAGGSCDGSASPPVCVLPPDPCEAIPADQRCAAAGTSCLDGTTLETCAPDAFGCLVRTPTDCAARAGGTCDPSVPAACAFTGDPCDGITECATPGATCDGPDLVECRRDGFGCYVEVRTTCTDTAFGFCDEAATPRPVCSTAASDPCLGMTECAPLGRACDGDTLRVCATNAFGCDLETATACGATMQVCDETSGTPACVDPCSLVDTCPSASYCDGPDAVTCAPNADGCLVETARTPCTGLCDAASGMAICVADTLCPEAERTILDCSSGTVSSTTVGGTTVLTAYPGPTCSVSMEYGGPERIFRFFHTGPDRAAVTLRTTSTMMAVDHDLFVLDADFTSMSCTTGVSCLVNGTSGTAGENVTFIVEPGDVRYIVYDDFGPLPASPIPFDLEVSCAPVVCGDGALAGEPCDDGNTVGGDGCSATCEPEPGWFCSGTPSVCRFLCGNGVVDPGEGCDDGNTVAADGCSAVCVVETGYRCNGAPSRCIAIAPNGTCATPAPLTLGTPIMASTAAGGLPPMGAGCAPSFGDGSTLYYSLSVAAGQTVAIGMTPSGFDAVLSIVDDCAADSCTAFADVPGVGPETLVYTNSTGSAETIVIAAASVFGGGDFTLVAAPTVCGDGVVAPGETCDDMDTTGGDGCSATCTVELGYSCTGAPSVCTRAYTVAPIAAACVGMTGSTSPIAMLGDDLASPVVALPFAFTYFGEAATHYAVTTNGNLQLFPAASGMVSTAFTNSALPSATPPNGLVAPFWDDLVPMPTPATPTLRERVTGTAPNRRLVVEWEEWMPIGSPGDSLRFQIWLREGSNQIEFHYCSLTGGPRSGGSSATIGLENMSGTGAAQVSFDTVGAVATGDGYRFTP